jgi:hypothetical protein
MALVICRGRVECGELKANRLKAFTDVLSCMFILDSVRIVVM